MEPDFSTSNVDIFGCGSTLGNLLRFVRSVDKPFRFLVEVIGNTVFFVRKENDAREIIEGVRGYGHTFPEAYTTWESDVKGSESHQRLIQYDLGGLECIVRFECDGYMWEKSGDQKANVLKGNSRTGLDDLLHAFDNTAIKRGLSSLDVPLSIQTGGSPPTQRAIFDLKTRSGRFKKEIDMTDIYPSLWLKQFTNFIVAFHDGAGTFEDVRMQDIRKDVQTWEMANKAAIQRLAVLLKKIVEIARQDRTGLLEVYSPAVDRLEVRRQHGEGVHTLPPGLSSAWEGVRFADSTAGANSDQAKEEVPTAKYEPFSDSDSDDGGQDFTACSADTCGYCGKCTY